MTNRSSANAVLVALVFILWAGFILPDLIRLHDGVLVARGYLHYSTARAVFDLTGVAGAIVLSVIAARAARRGPASSRGRGMTAGAVGVLIVQVIIMAMIPLGFLAGMSFY